MSTRLVSLVFYSDSMHGWFAVPESLYKASGLKASPYSYRCKHRGLVFLEEDCDAPLFYRYLKSLGLEVSLTERYEHVSFIRSLGRMS